MVFDTDLRVFLIYAAVIMMVCLAGRLLLAPMKIVARLVLNSLLGGLVLLVMNGIGFGVLIPLNFITAAVAGAVGLPGVAGMLIYYQNIL